MLKSGFLPDILSFRKNPMIPSAVSVFIATVIGYSTFRLHGPYFSIATIACGEAIRVLIQYFDRFTKGAAGMYVTYRKPDFLALTFANDIPFYYIALAKNIQLTRLEIM